MFLNFLTINLINFAYEINFIQNLWFYHFVDFCFALNFEDISFILAILYFLCIIILNTSIILKRLHSLFIITVPLKLILDFLIIYFISKLLFLIFYYFVFIYSQEFGETLYFINLMFFFTIFFCSLVVLPIIYFKISNKLIFRKMFDLDFS
jgi:hypothetical protein